MPHKFLVIDTSHMLFRARMVSTQGDIWLRTGLAIHLMFNIIRKSWKKFNADHIVFALEGKSWRKAIYEPYKKNRQELRALKTEIEIEEDQIFYTAINDVLAFISEKTNCTVLQNPICESDDMIARWVQTHPDDEHIIVSSDTDFTQLLSKNVSIYNGVDDLHLTLDGVIDDKGFYREFSVKSNSKLKIGEKLKPGSNWMPEEDWHEWATFIKIMRGDSGDNIFSAFPKVRLTKLKQAFDDRKTKGYIWNNMMLERWTDHNGEDHRVRDCYERNLQLIDLTKQPDEIKLLMDQTILEATAEPKSVKNIGIHFLKLAGKYELTKISENPKDYVDFLSAKLVK